MLRKFLNLREDENIGWFKSFPFLLIHGLAVWGLFHYDTDPIHWIVCVGLMFARMFFITGGYHRYFSHQTYELNRFWQFWMAVGGCTAAQKGPLWWLHHHIIHHRKSDQDGDPHNSKRGFWYSHVIWILLKENDPTDMSVVPDKFKVPELIWMDRYLIFLVPPTLLGLACYLLGGGPMLFIGFFLSTVLTWHITFCVNSLTHKFGTRQFKTPDDSRNSFWLAWPTLGEANHNNHHRFPRSVRMGFGWKQPDITYWILAGLRVIGVTKNFRVVTQEQLDAAERA